MKEPIQKYFQVGTIQWMTHTPVPVFRPLIGMDKQEIVNIAERIDTFETSIQPFEDCCTIFVAKHPVTKGNLKKIEKSEENLADVIEELMEKAIETTEVIVVK